MNRKNSSQVLQYVNSTRGMPISFLIWDDKIVLFLFILCKNSQGRCWYSVRPEPPSASRHSHLNIEFCYASYFKM